jgi:hypothetical protein
MQPVVQVLLMSQRVMEVQRKLVLEDLLKGWRGHLRHEGAVVELMTPLKDEVFDVPE